MLKEVGIDVQWNLYDGTTWASKRNSKDFDLTCYWVNYAPDPATYDRYFQSKGANNYMGYNNSRVDELLAKAVQTPVWEERLKYYYEVQEILVKDIPWVPVVNEMYFLFKRKGWHGLPSDLPPDGGMGRMMTWMGGQYCVWHDSGSDKAPAIHYPWKVQEVTVTKAVTQTVQTGMSAELQGVAVVAALIVGFAAGYFLRKSKKPTQ
jgi:hypothetical protein